MQTIEVRVNLMKYLEEKFQTFSISFGVHKIEESEHKGG